jgi:hypothetical protein
MPLRVSRRLSAVISCDVTASNRRLFLGLAACSILILPRVSRCSARFRAWLRVRPLRRACQPLPRRPTRRITSPIRSTRVSSMSPMRRLLRWAPMFRPWVGWAVVGCQAKLLSNPAPHCHSLALPPRCRLLARRDRAQCVPAEQPRTSKARSSGPSQARISRPI